MKNLIKKLMSIFSLKNRESYAENRDYELIESKRILVLSSDLPEEVVFRAESLEFRDIENAEYYAMSLSNNITFLIVPGNTYKQFLS